MHIHTLMFGWEFPPLHSGGLGVACEGLVHGLLQNGVQVTLVLPSRAPDAPGGVSMLSPDGFPYSVVSILSALQPYAGGIPLRVASETIGVEELSELYGPSLGEAVNRFAEESVQLTTELHPNVIHCHDWMTYEAGVRARGLHDVPLIAHIHATELDRTDFHPNPWIAERERQGLLAADVVIAVSHYTKNLIVSHYGIPPDKVHTVHNGHDVSGAARQPVTAEYKRRKARIVLFLGRMTIQKNPWQFLEVARRVKTLRPDVQFIMAGDGPLLPELLERSCALGLSDCVLFTGKVRRAEVEALYRKADCFVMPSVSEPFGLVALEAIAQGVPVILSKQSGAAEVIDHAFKVDYWDTEKMADCILTVLRDPALALQLRSEAPRILQRLSWKNQSAVVASLYHSLLH